MLLEMGKCVAILNKMGRESFTEKMTSKQKPVKDKGVSYVDRGEAEPSQMWKCWGLLSK